MTDEIPEGAEPTQEELFPEGVVDGDGVQLKDLVKPGHTVELTCALSRAEVPLRSGLPDPNRRLRVMVTGVPGKLHPLPLREDAHKPLKVTGWKIAQDVRVDYVECVPLEDEALILNRVRAMLDASPQAAGALAEKINAIVAEYLSAA